jgi:3'(2'), 5'-bisphosphate nucleotidase
MPFREPIRQALQRASSATELLRHSQRRVKRKQKSNHTPVTVADVASQALLLATLADYTDDGIIYAEEELDSLSDESFASEVIELVSEVLGRSVAKGEIKEWVGQRGGKRSSDIAWYVDPVDGTKGYIRGLYYSIAIARREGDYLTHGWIAVPSGREPLEGFTGHLFEASRGEGVRSIRLDNLDSVPLIAPPASMNRLTIAASRAHSSVDLPKPLRKQNDIEIHLLSMDSQAKYAALVTGHADIYPRKVSRWIGPFYCWDHAAGALLVREAGGECTDLYGEPLRWTQGERLTRNRGIFAARNPELYQFYQPLFHAHVV